MNILIVMDSDSTLAQELSTALTHDLARFAVVTDPQQLERALETKPDAVVVDASLQWVDPALLVRSLRARARGLHLVAVCSSADSDFGASLLQAGALYCVPRDDLGKLRGALRWLQPETETSSVRLEGGFLFEPLAQDIVVAFLVLRLENGDAGGLLATSCGGDVDAVFGVSAAQVTGRLLCDALPWLFDSPVPAALMEVLATGQAREVGELRRDAQPGGACYTVKAFLMTDRSIGLVCEDVARLRAVQDAQLRTQEQLLQARKMEALGRLASGVAHDFNNLMTAIMGYSDLVLADLDVDSPMRSDMEEIQKATEKASALTRQLSALGPRQVINLREVDINDLMGDLEPRLRQAGGAGVALQLALQQGIAPVMADAGRLEQVLLNLVDNAREAMPAGGRVVLETSLVSLQEPQAGRLNLPPADYLVIGVVDTGSGMDVETRTRMFEPFFSTKAHSQGLGLATVFGYVRHSHGAIDVDTEKGRGTRISLYLPCAAATLPAPPQEEKVVLLAEDEEIINELMGRILRRQGLRVLSGRNGQEALRLSQEHAGPIHLLITDVIMPHMGGAELASLIQTLRPETRILFISGYTDSKLVNKGLNLTAIDFLHKPFTPQVFQKKVFEILGRKMSHQS